MGEKAGRGTYDGNDTVVFQEGVQTLQELDGEEVDGLCAAGEDVMHDIIVLRGRGFLGAAHEDGGVLDGGDVVGWKIEVLQGVFVHDRVDFHDGGFDAVRDERSRSGADAETAVIS